MHSNSDDAERKIDFDTWVKRVYSREPVTPVVPVRNADELEMSAEDEKFLRDCGVKPK